MFGSVHPNRSRFIHPARVSIVYGAPLSSHPPSLLWPPQEQEQLHLLLLRLLTSPSGPAHAQTTHSRQLFVTDSAMSHLPLLCSLAYSTVPKVCGGREPFVCWAYQPLCMARTTEVVVF